MSDDGRHAISVIAMLGNVFSPFYAAARVEDPRAANPLMHVALNVGVYTPRRSFWALTERPESSLRRSAQSIQLGPSSLAWHRGDLTVRIDERTAPWPGRIEGRVTLSPTAPGGDTLTLDARGAHRWTPIAPRARAEVDLTAPRVRFSGHAYLDANEGDEGLEDAFRSWSWSRVASDRRSTVTYAIERRDGTRLSVARSFGDELDATSFPVVATTAATTRWRIPRTIDGEPSSAPRLLATLEDTPFYARSLIETSFFGERAVGTHEVLSLDRFRSRLVHKMIPFRMRRQIV